MPSLCGCGFTRATAVVAMSAGTDGRQRASAALGNVAIGHAICGMATTNGLRRSMTEFRPRKHRVNNDMSAQHASI
jgi:hypothetical protein